MISVKLFLDQRTLRKDGTFAVRIGITNKGNFFIASGVCVAAEDWDGYAVLKSDRFHKTKNAKLTMLLDKINIVVLDVERKTPNVSNKTLKEYINRALSGKESTIRLLTDVLDEHVNNKSSKQTILSYLQTKDKIVAFDKRVAVDNINVSWLTQFNKYMLDSGLSINSAGIHLRNLRAVMNYALDNEYTDNYPFRRYKIKSQETAKRSLSLDQLRQFINHPVEEYLQQYKDIFMLSFYLCGINLVDLVNCKEITADGRIEYYRSKTKKLYSIKVEPEAMAIINKHKGKEYLIDIMERYSDYRTYNGRINRKLKRIGKLEVIDNRGTKKYTSLFPGISLYWARHTWASIAARAGVSDDVISQALGHSTTNTTTAIYINRNLQMVDDANRKVLNLLNKKIKVMPPTRLETPPDEVHSYGLII